jgi:hypothetical protein
MCLIELSIASLLTLGFSLPPGASQLLTWWRTNINALRTLRLNKKNDNIKKGDKAPDFQD